MQFPLSWLQLHLDTVEVSILFGENCAVDKDELGRKASMMSDKLKHASSGWLECRGRSRTKSFEDFSHFILNVIGLIC